MKRLLSIAVCAVLVACGGSDSPTSPTPPPSSNPPPAQTTHTITGVISAAPGGTISGAVARIDDGPNAGQQATTDGSGRYTLANLRTAGQTLNVSASGYLGTSRGITLNAPSHTMNFTLLTEQPWRRNGSGDTVFDMPTYISRVRIIGTYNGFTSNFIVRVGGRLLVNELLGTGWSMTRYDGTLLTSGGVVEITHSSGVQWAFEESR